MQNLKFNLRQECKNGACMVSGSLCIALGVVLFLAPNKIATGGTPGIAILLSYLFKSVSLGTLMLVINIPLLLAGMKYLGKAFGIRTVISIILVSLFTDLLKLGFRVEPVSDDPLLAALFGGLIIGTGVGLVLRGQSSAGGSTIIARIMAHKLHIRPGRTILALDAIIIASSAVVFNGIEPSLWSLVSIYATSHCIDIILTGGPAEKVIHIVTDKVETLSRVITESIGPNGTILHGKGLQGNEEKTMIFIVLESARIPLLRDIIHRHDPQAFMIVMDAAEMLGRGHQPK